MRILVSYPPNYAEIKKVLNPPPDAVFAFGAVLYNPSGQELPPDILIHEEAHEKQMRGWRPESWWTKYLMDSAFRLSVEIPAYAAQYRFVKERIDARGAKLCLSDLAQNLAALYNVS